jgi:small conductance mechanosensitive channel
LRLALIALLALAARSALRVISVQAQKRLELSVVDAERLDRLKTLVRVGEGVVLALVFLLGGLMALNVLNINIAPLLAGAGVAGLAISLGAQTLIKDYIGGVLVLLEDQFSVGDVIQVDAVSGVVERITLRATYVRAGDGALHLIPNGDLRTVANLTVGWSRAVADLHVDYRADMERVTRALHAAARRVQEDETVKDHLLEAPQVFGWLGFKDWAVQVQLMAKVKPGQQWAVARAMRRHALEALQAEDVRVATPAATQA